MENYWAIYNEYFDEYFNNTYGHIEKNQTEMNEIFINFGEIFLCDDFSWLPSASLLIFFYNKGPINTTHELIIIKLFEDLKLESVKYIIKNLKKGYEEKLKKIQRQSISIRQQARREQNLNNINVCLDSIGIVEENFEQIDHSLFKGEFTFSKTPKRNKRKSIREILPELNREKIEYTTRYRLDDAHQERLLETWSLMMYQEYPESVCISKKDSLLLDIEKKDLDEINTSKYVYKYYKEIYSLEPDQRLFIPIDELLNCNQKFFITILSLRYKYPKMGHANALVFDSVNKCIYRFEPHGVDETTDEKLKSEIRKQYPILDDFEYIGTSKTCPYSPMGVQIIEGMVESTLKRPIDTGGSNYCFIWSLMYLHYVLQYNDIYKPSEIHNYLIHEIDNLTEIMYQYTYFILLQYKDLLESEYPFQNTEFIERDRGMLLDVSNQEIKKLFNVFLFDVNNEHNLVQLYMILYHGFIDFTEIVKIFFDLSFYLGPFALNNINNFLLSLEKGNLYNKLVEINEQYTKLEIEPHIYISDKFLPRIIVYYQDIVKKSFQKYIERNEIIDKEGAEALKQMYRQYFHESLK